jgi:hypothetical protein
MMKGHALTGVWLEEAAFPEVVISNRTAITNRFQAGVNKLTVVQATELAAGSQVKFEDAEASAMDALSQNNPSFEFVVDIFRGRSCEIIPLPIRVMGSDGWEVKAPEVGNIEGVAPQSNMISKAVLDEASHEKTKKQLWERSLLDLSMRNSLLNMKPGGKVLPVLLPQPEDIVRSLSEGTSFSISAKPEEFSANSLSSYLSCGVPKSLEPLVHEEFENGRLRTSLTDTDTKNCLVNLYRQAKLIWLPKFRHV